MLDAGGFTGWALPNPSRLLLSPSEHSLGLRSGAWHRLGCGVFASPGRHTHAHRCHLGKIITDLALGGRTPLIQEGGPVHLLDRNVLCQTHRTVFCLQTNTLTHNNMLIPERERQRLFFIFKTL